MNAVPGWLWQWGLAASDASAMSAAGWPLDRIARVVSEHRGIFSLATAHGERLGRVAGKLHFAEDSTQAHHGYPVVGDWVQLGVDEQHSEFAPIAACWPRRALLRRARANKDVQFIAANMDQVLIVVASDGLLPRQRAAQYAAVVDESHIPWRVVYTKVDLATPPEDATALAVCNIDARGISAVFAALAGKTTLMVGDSGAGKSSLLNALLGTDLQRTAVLTTGGEGRHTTTARRLMPLLIDDAHGACIIDSPGWRHVRTAVEIAAAKPPEAAYANNSARTPRRGGRTPRTSRR